MIRIINIREHPQWLGRAAEYFSSRFPAEGSHYAGSVKDSVTTEKPAPRWYIMLKGVDVLTVENVLTGVNVPTGDNGPVIVGGIVSIGDDEPAIFGGTDSTGDNEPAIIGGIGLIEADSAERTDLSPWICGLYVEPDERGRGLGAALLTHARREAAALGFAKLYIKTEMAGYFEKYDWRYIGSYIPLNGSHQPFDGRHQPFKESFRPLYYGYARIYEIDTLLIHTTRLTLRPFTESDAAGLSEISRQPAARRYLSDMVWEAEEEAKRFIIRYNLEKYDERAHRVIMAVTLKNDGRCIGFVGIGPKPELGGEIEIGFLTAETHKNKGYATEACRALIWWFFERKNQDVINAITEPENKASRRVLEKLGFAYGGERIFDDGSVFDCFRLYHTDTLPGPVWDMRNLYRAEKMGDFFNARADGYNEHMLNLGSSKRDDSDYVKFAKCFPRTKKRLAVLDVGCGTGLELDYIWKRAPNAHMTCLDISRGMLDLLLKNHPCGHARLTVIEASFVDWDYPADAFDIVASHAAMHHFWHDEKVEIYKKIYGSLKQGGYYIEGDFIVDEIHSEQYRRRYELITESLPAGVKPGEFHIDIPFTIKVQIKLLCAAGFSHVELIHDNIALRGSGAMLKAVK